MSKANDDAPVSGPPEADHVEPGKPDETSSDGPPSVDDASQPASVGSTSRRSRRAAEAPVDAVPEQRRERESQARARNREALRAYRALAESQAAQDDDGTRVEIPTRRQLRLQQTQIRTGDSQADPSGEPAAGATADVPGATGSALGVGTAGADGAARAAEPSTNLTALPDALPVAPAAAPGGGNRGAAPAASGARSVPLPGGRRDRRRQNTAQTTAVDGGGPSATATSATAPQTRRIEDMTVEEALAARQAIVEDARKHAAGLNASGADDPFTVDLEVLSQQKALAERAAVLNSRARRMQELSEQNQQRKPAANDPTTAHNLSIVAPPEFVRMPGGAQSVLRAPSTSHVPVVLPRPQRAPVVPPTAHKERDGAQAEVQSAERNEGTEPIEARSAFGLEPLDAETAGLGRLRRLRYIQYSMLGVGAAALITGIIMTVSSLNG